MAKSTATVRQDTKDLRASNITEADLPHLPYMTSWFEPLLLLKLLLRVIISDVFGQYADRRLMEAALDPVGKEEHVRRAKLDAAMRGANEAVWLDYVSDLGDGFDATYAIAYLLAQPELLVDGKILPRADALVMGGDQVYPTSLRDDYLVKMRLPYDLAWPLDREHAKTPLFLLPGNHDWYDGLVTFLAMFCREKSTRIGGWITKQRRSYFAAEVASGWWVWGIDIALVRDMDQPQADYFVAIAEAMPPNSNIILCSAEPGWYKAEANGDGYRTLSYAAQIANNAKKDLRIPLILSGDSHHYARYEGDGSQYITSGGGGAFLHGTLELKPEITAKWLRMPEEKLNLKECYPTKSESSKLLSGNWKFGWLNRGLTWALSGLYLASAFLLTSAWRTDVAVAVFLALLGTLWGYSRYQEGGWKRTAIPSFGHAIAHMTVILGITWVALWASRTLLEGVHLPWQLWLLALAIPIAAIGPWISGVIYGLSLMIGCRHFNIGHNDAFSAMKLDSHRHFLRIRLKGDEATVYPIKLGTVPSRNQWRANPAQTSEATPSVFVAEPPLKPELLEQPIVVPARQAASTSDVRTQGEM